MPSIAILRSHAIDHADKLLAVLAFLTLLVLPIPLPGLLALQSIVFDTIAVLAALTLIVGDFQRRSFRKTLTSPYAKVIEAAPNGIEGACRPYNESEFISCAALVVAALGQLLWTNLVLVERQVLFALVVALGVATLVGIIQLIRITNQHHQMESRVDTMMQSWQAALDDQ